MVLARTPRARLAHGSAVSPARRSIASPGLSRRSAADKPSRPAVRSGLSKAGAARPAGGRARAHPPP
jgi:hypothetical protein